MFTCPHPSVDARTTTKHLGAEAGGVRAVLASEHLVHQIQISTSTCSLFVWLVADGWC
jgi:hypothetical protein